VISVRRRAAPWRALYVRPVEAGARNSGLRAKAAVVALAGVLSVGAATAAPAAAAQLGSAPAAPTVKAASAVEAVTGAVASAVPATPVVPAAAPVADTAAGALNSAGSVVQRTVDRPLAAVQGAAGPAVEAATAVTGRVAAPATQEGGPAAGPAPGRADPPIGGQNSAPQTVTPRRRHSSPAVSGTKPPPAGQGHSRPGHTRAATAYVNSFAALPQRHVGAAAEHPVHHELSLAPSVPSAGAGTGTASAAAAGSMAGLALLVLALLLAAPGTGRRLKLPMVAWRPPAFVSLLERPG
jgi:hypothetical protein